MAASQEVAVYGYADMLVERVASEAGYTRGALYHLFACKQDLALALVQWAEETWYEEVGHLFDDDADPVGALLAVARGHAIYCRTDLGLAIASLSVEFRGRDHPVGRAVKEALGRLVNHAIRLIKAGRQSGAIPPGPPPRVLALAYLGVINSSVARPLRGQASFDTLLAERAVLGVLGLPPTLETGNA
jgi:AcrR family transcriptional regulator